MYVDCIFFTKQYFYSFQEIVNLYFQGFMDQILPMNTIMDLQLPKLLELPQLPQLLLQLIISQVKAQVNQIHLCH